ncbi:MAG: thiamine-phosphate kinase, partial [Pyrinomonadaceae bacterium]
GDDCAVLPKDDQTDMVVTADMLVEDIDFRLDWTTPEFLGHKALAVSLSDIAAMGAKPKWAMLSIAVPANLWKGSFIGRFYDGWHNLAASFSVELIGGDISRSPDKLVIDSVVFGEVGGHQAVFRSTARPGQTIFVSGPLGGAAGGLRLLEDGELFGDDLAEADKNLILRQLQPAPRVELATILRSQDMVTSMIDISDGFSSDLAHLCEASGLGATIANIPVDQNLLSHFSPAEALQMALHGGEDFELLFTAERDSEIRKLPVKAVGVTSTRAGVIEFIEGDATSILEPKGYRHF